MWYVYPANIGRSLSSFSGTMGAPCSHTILARLRSQGDNPSSLGMGSFDGHWWLENCGNAPARPERRPFDQVVEPLVVGRSRGRPRAAQTASSTRRNLIAWEVEAAKLASARRPDAGARTSVVKRAVDRATSSPADQSGAIILRWCLIIP
jgi:hypothetical protein